MWLKTLFTYCILYFLLLFFFFKFLSTYFEREK